MKGDSFWVCIKCSLLNTDRLSCEQCDTPMESFRIKKKNRDEDRTTYVSKAIQLKIPKSNKVFNVISLQPIPESPYDLELYESNVFSNHEEEIFQRMQSFKLTLDLKYGGTYTIHTKFLSPYSPTDPKMKLRKTILCLHGFGASCTWATWLKLTIPILNLSNNGVDLLFVDLPGFGRSSGRDIQTKTWKNDGPEIVVGILNAFRKTTNVSVVGFCGGAATFYRTIVKYPSRFKNCNHVFHNSVTSEVPKQLPEILAKEHMKMYLSWIEDIDHSRYCLAYKWFDNSRKAKKYDDIIEFENLSDEILGAVGAHCNPTLTRLGADSVFVFYPSEQYLNKTVPFLLRL
eukprot:TRINITY_DN18287_c0_g1_i1.p1 TRINITY_DN18287_c0_g1~~TRINITY_DN18287_c0_g1_i1.p1  ORF type:complete len:344 (-),score=28.87 TRINITY_DN18287_c0_g1_i1:30-1061(-)